MSNDLSSAKVGDELVIRHHLLDAGILRRVERRTKTQVIDDRGVKWNLLGREVSRARIVGVGSWARLATDADRVEIRRARQISDLSNLRSSELKEIPSGALEVAWKALAPHLGKGES